MIKRNQYAIGAIFFAILAFLCSCSDKVETKKAGSKDYETLVSLYQEFRKSIRPKVTNGIPDYTANAMERQKSRLDEMQRRLYAIDPIDLSTSQQVDYHLVRAEMNGLEFYHRVIRPWSTDPDFYATRNIEIRRMPSIHLTEDDITTKDIILGWIKNKEELQLKLRAVPKILEQAKENLILSEAKGDMAMLAMRTMKDESVSFQELEILLSEKHPDLVQDALQAKLAVEDFHDWLKENKAEMNKPAGVGKENYNWWLKNVWLFPYTWDECWTVAKREYERAVSTLKLEEHRNRRIPKLMPVETEEEFNRQWKEAEELLLKFVREKGIFTEIDYLVPLGPAPFKTWATNPGRYGPVNDFFEELGDRDPMTEITHNTTGHNFDSLRNQRYDHPIRSLRRLFGLNRIRSEGVAFGFEEILMHAGLFDNRERGREIVYIAAAYRAVRAMAGLKLHSNEFTYDEACQFDADNCPYGWATKDSFTMWSHRQSTPRLPGNEMGYLMGKVQFEKLIADRAMQLGEKFELREFYDEFFSAGMIPFALIRWEMTGLDDEIKELW